MKKIFIIVSLVISSSLVAQNEAANWYFGQNAGITFDDSGNLVGAVNDGLLETLEGCTSISDVDGNLLFYTDGNIVYNRNHQLMPNGTGLFGDSSSTQSALVVPQPGSDSIYFIFTVDSAATDGIDEGFNYSVVDITLDGGLGDIISKNSPLLNKCSEKITAVLKDCGSGSIWVITLAAQNGIGGTFNTYHAFEITTTGINTTSVKSTFPINIGDPRGQIKVSPNGEKFISANMQNGLYLYDFDANTGTLSNQQSLIIVSTSPSPYGVEFSQNSSKLYVHSTNNAGASAPASSHRSTLTQFDLLETDIQSSAFVLDQQSLYRGSLQLAANGKIYRALSANYQTGLPALGVIDNPNEQGAAATYIHNAIDLSPGLSTQGLPPFIQSFFNDQIDIIQNGENSLELSLCEGETYTLSYADLPGAIYTWTKDGVTQSNTTFEFEISESGYYTLNVEFNNGDCEVFDGEATVTFYEVPIANTAPNLGICDDDNDGSWQFDFTTQDATVLGVQDSSRFEIKYFQTQSDADNNDNEILGVYANTDRSEEIFVRIHNVGNINCFDTTSFQIDVYDSPFATNPNDIEICDDDTDGDQQNGQVTTDLSLLDEAILNGQDPSSYHVTYHHSLADATNGVDAITSPYYNASPNLEEIVARVENIQNNQCFDTTSFNLIIHDVPRANIISDLQVCDDNNDGSFSFNLNTLYDTTVIGAQDPTSFNVQYYLTSEDASNNTNAISMPFDTTDNPQIVHIRITNNLSENCFDTTAFQIEIFDTPTANEIADFPICDNNNDGNDLNGQVSVDLLMFDSDVLNGQDASLYNITYHSSQAEADVGSNPIASPYYNVTPFTEEIFVRIENILNTNCFDTTSFNLIVNPLPTVFDALIFQCDYDGNPDGFTLFNLTEASGEITANDPNLSTQFYLSEIDAENATNVIDGTSFSNTVNPQIINVRVINNTTGCYRLAELTLDVSATSVNDAEIFKCDDDGTEDGFVEFDLSEADAAVLGGSPPGITLVYYQTAEDALLEINPLNTNFTNTQAYFQTIYVRAENDNDCYGINEVELTVYELPDIDIEDQTIYCLNNFPETITIDAGLTTGNPNDFNYLWSTGEDTYEININEVGTYTVEIGNNNSCSKSRTITVLPSNIATISNIDVIDATSNNTITIIVSGEGDYEFAIDNISGPYQDSNLFENVSPGLHDVYIRDKNNCGIVQELVSVIGFPKFFTPNNDGYNDTWQVYGINVSSQQESIIYVFDRFGKLVKQLSPSDSGWDGTFNGQPLPSSDYWFHIKLQDGRTFKSHFTLKR